MGRSLQEQLLEKGLVTEEQLERVKRADGPRPRRGERAGGGQRRDRKRRGRRRDGAARAAPGPAQVPAGPKADERRRAELRAQIRALVLAGQQNDPKGEVAHHFVRGGRVKRVWVTPEQHRGLAAGELAVTAARGRHWVVPAALGEQIASLDPGHFVHRVVPGEAGPEEAADEYAGYEVPDDLMW